MEFKTIITLPFLGARVVIDFLSSAVLGIIWRPRQWSYVRNLKYTFLNSMCKHDIFPLIIKSATTLDNYLLYMKSQKAKPEVVTFEDGSGGGWIGSSKSKNILIHFHGGAYTNPASEIHMRILGDLVGAAQVRGKELGVFVVEYGLSPKTTYPAALIQSANALNYILQTTKKDPKNGNRLAGGFLLSPWVTFESSSDSIKENSKVDFIEQRVLIPQAHGFLGLAEEDSYNVPLKAPTEWWDKLRVKDLYILAGDYEIFRDDIVELAKKIQIHNPNVEYFVEPAEVHVQALVDRGLKLGIAKSEDRFRDWILSRL